jgi:secondary thiamine-phosphate synthase enzyme
MKEISVRSASRFEMIDITEAIRQATREEKIESGIVLVYTPHTTAAVTINENADPDVPRDLLALDRARAPVRELPAFEGNSARTSNRRWSRPEMVIVGKRPPCSGTWQSIFFLRIRRPPDKESLLLNYCRDRSRTFRVGNLFAMYSLRLKLAETFEERFKSCKLSPGGAGIQCCQGLSGIPDQVQRNDGEKDLFKTGLSG